MTKQRIIDFEDTVMVRTDLQIVERLRAKRRTRRGSRRVQQRLSRSRNLQCSVPSQRADLDEQTMRLSEDGALRPQARRGALTLSRLARLFSLVPVLLSISRECSGHSERALHVREDGVSESFAGPPRAGERELASLALVLPPHQLSLSSLDL